MGTAWKVGGLQQVQRQSEFQKDPLYYIPGLGRQCRQCSSKEEGFVLNKNEYDSVHRESQVRPSTLLRFTIKFISVKPTRPTIIQYVIEQINYLIN